MRETFVTIGSNHAKRQEGDVWEERGKLWTIKNGIKRTVTKMDQARKELLMPLSCPECGRSMNHHFNEQSWATHKSCFECVIDAEHKHMKDGTYQQYEKDVMLKNAKAFASAFEEYIDDYMKESVAQNSVTEDGLIEKWKDVDQSHLENIKGEVLEKLNDNIKQIEGK